MSTDPRELGYDVKILLDSISEAGHRLVTWELTYPRFIHAEFMTHRVFSRNAASSRAIPIEKFIERVMTRPAMPLWWGRNQSGMQAREELDPRTRMYAETEWLKARDAAVLYAKRLKELGLHKQIVNRVLEPWLYITVIASATEDANFFHLRKHKDAQPEFAWVAGEMHRLKKACVPVLRKQGEWHLPLISAADIYDIRGHARHATHRFEYDNHAEAFYDRARKISVGRCARVSYLTHDGVRDHEKDIELHDKLLAGQVTDDPMHMSPFEHVATPHVGGPPSNFVGWLQYRKTIKGENFTGEEARGCSQGGAVQGQGPPVSG